MFNNGKLEYQNLITAGLPMWLSGKNLPAMKETPETQA